MYNISLVLYIKLCLVLRLKITLRLSDLYAVLIMELVNYSTIGLELYGCCNQAKQLTVTMPNTF